MLIKKLLLKKYKINPLHKRSQIKLKVALYLLI